MSKTELVSGTRQNPVEIQGEEPKKKKSGRYKHGHDEWTRIQRSVVKHFKPDCDPETWDLICRLDKKSKYDVLYTMYLGEGSNTPVSKQFGIEHRGWDGMQTPVAAPQIKAPQPGEQPVRTRPPTYRDQLHNEGYKLIKIEMQENRFFTSMAMGIQRLAPNDPLNPKDGEEIRNRVLEELLSKPELYKDYVLALIIGEIWESMKKTNGAKIEELLSRLPVRMREPLSYFYNAYWSVEPEQQELVLNDLMNWSNAEGVNDYIDGIKEGHVFGGALEAGIIATLYKLPVTIHKIEPNGSGFPVYAGDETAPPDLRLHLYHYNHQFDLICHPAPKTR